MGLKTTPSKEESLKTSEVKEDSSLNQTSLPEAQSALDPQGIKETITQFGRNLSSDFMDFFNNQSPLEGEATSSSLSSSDSPQFVLASDTSAIIAGVEVSKDSLSSPQLLNVEKLESAVQDIKSAIEFNRYEFDFAISHLSDEGVTVEARSLLGEDIAIEVPLPTYLTWPEVEKTIVDSLRDQAHLFVPLGVFA